MATEEIKLMPDYGCWPLWWAGEHEPGNIDPRTLPLLPETVARIQAWAVTFDSSLNWDDPASSVGFTQEQAEEFEQEGMALWHQLQEELSPMYKVVYRSIGLS